MKTTKILLLVACLDFGCTKTTSVKPADNQLVGKWDLVRITAGFSQITRSAAEAGYLEVLTFNADGTYQRLADGTGGRKDENGRYYTGANSTKTADSQAIFYPNDTTTQPYSYRDNNLFLYQRGKQGSTIYDGSTYEYQRH